jgi:putative flippase GtrA
MMHKVISYAQKHREIVTYIVFGVLTTAVNYLVFLFSCEMLNMSATASNIVAWILAVLFAFLTNKPFVFKTKSWSRRVVIPEFVKFVACRIGSGILETGFLFVTVDCINWNGSVLKLIASGFVMVLNYISGRRVAFKKS